MYRSSFTPEALDAVRQQWPSLQEIPEDATPGASLRHAATNIRTLLKHQWPEAHFWVTCQRFSMGNSISIQWAGEGAGLDEQAVEQLANPFIHSTFDGSTDSTISVKTNREFRELFGSVKYLHVNKASPTREATHKAAQISRGLPKPSKRSPGPRF
jgi:hypothetical protein